MDRSNEMLRNCLVGVVNNNADLERFMDERWYRIPARAVGHAISADALAQAEMLALYQTGSISNGLRSAIELWGEIEDIAVRPRKELLPDESSHPAADELYHQVRLKSVQQLEHPITSRRPRRVTFLRTTAERLLRASDINELIVGTATEEKLWSSLKELDAERKYYMSVQGTALEVDFAVFNGGQTMGVLCDTRDAPLERGQDWSILRFSPSRLEDDFATCLTEIMSTVREMREGIPVAR